MWGVSLLAVLSLSCVAHTDWGRAVVVAPAPATRTIEIAIREEGFVPHDITVKQGETVTLVFKREVERTCVKRVVVSLDNEHSVERELPRGIPVAVSLRFDHPGELGYSCAMAMVGGSILVTGSPAWPAAIKE